MKHKDGKFLYRLGIDVGVASLGVAILELDPDAMDVAGEQSFRIAAGVARTYPLPEGASIRREKRAMRRNIDRRKRRLDRLTDLLAERGLGYRRKTVPKSVLDLSPIKLRAQGSREKVDLRHLSRVFVHMARHRGSSAFRESDIKDDNESRQTAAGITSLRQEMKTRGFSTYGQYLRWREKQDLPLRINQNKMADSDGGYAFYPSREMLREEFEMIWEKQATFYPENLTPELKQTVSDELFFQRTVTAPPPGKCPYFTDEFRLPRASRLFQVRRIYEEVNNLRFSERSGKSISYDIAGRDMIVDRLMTGEDLTVSEIKKTIGLGRTDKVSLENASAPKVIRGYCFDILLGDEDILGDKWLDAGEDQQDQILNTLATIYDDDKAIAALSDLLDGDTGAAKRALDVSLPSGWGRMGPTATGKILPELKKDLIPARIAEDRACLSHAMTPTGEVGDLLPYYGKVLVGHTVDPMWVSDYRRETDQPPHTNANEQKYGRVPNPVVHLALNQIRETVNAVVKKYGLPETIHIELARDLNKSAEARAEIEKQNKKNKDVNDKAAKALDELSPPVRVSRLNIQKFKLWEEQSATCIYTGEPLSLKDLFDGDVDVDHILPRSKTYSDSMANKVVCKRRANADKGNQAPYQAFADRPDYDWDEIIRRVERLSPGKQWRFEADAMKQFEEDPEAFRARYGIDNSYIARLARQYLTHLVGEPHKVVAVSSYVVSMLRGKWGLNKVLGGADAAKKLRNDHRHHFIDALVAACTTPGTVQKIQREAARCEREQLDAFVETIAPPYGTPKEFFNAAREATFDRVLLSRKPDHAKTGQLHEDSLMGIVDGPDKNGSYICRKSKKLSDYATLEKLKKAVIKDTIAPNSEINRAIIELRAIQISVNEFAVKAKQILEDERLADIAVGKKGRTVSDSAVYKRAIQLHGADGGKKLFTLYEKQKLVNIRRAGDRNRPTGGYISGRNHRIDFYTDRKGNQNWQLVSMMAANDRDFVPEARKTGNHLIWSAHKDDTLEMTDPSAPNRRIKVVVAKLGEYKMGVVPEADAGDAKVRVLWEKGLSFFKELEARRVVTNAAGDVTWRFSALSPPSAK